jgi:Malectin domain
MSSTRQQPVEVENRRAELTKVLHSEMFVRAPVLGHLLTYLCEKTFAGEIHEIKEYSIALDVFGRNPSFDQDSDSIVRVHANRLRKRLAEYYEKVGASDPIHISIPVGQYVPAFQEARQTAAQMEPITTEPNDAQSATSSKAVAGKKQRFWMILFLATAALLVVAALFILKGRKVVPQPPQTDVQPATIFPVGLPVGDEVRILSGATHPYVDRSGKMWTADTYFTGGTSVKGAVQFIWRTQDSFLYRYSRQGDFNYDVPMKPGVYEMRLHFVETYFGPDETGGGGEGSRIMNVILNGRPLLTNFDVMADAGASRTADEKVFTDVSPASDGKIHLRFSSVYGGQAMVSAIEILPGVRGHIRPIRIATRTSPYYSIDSHWWSPDNYYKGGQLGESKQPAIGTDDPELYQTERWGNFSYSIPVPAGKYKLLLHFIERRFGPTNEGGQVVPARTKNGASLGRDFNVFCNGKAILRNFNILSEAGENRAYVRSFSGLEPNAQGKLLLEFAPIHDYATVTAIEVIPD